MEITHNMKLIRVFAILAVATTVAACSAYEYDDTQIKQDIANLQRKVSALENLCASMNTNISAIQTIASAAQSGNYITSVAPITYNGKEITCHSKLLN